MQKIKNNHLSSSPTDVNFMFIFLNALLSLK